MKTPEDGFVFPADLRSRLRELRKKAGLSQDELAKKGQVRIPL